MRTLSMAAHPVRGRVPGYAPRYQSTVPALGYKALGANATNVLDNRPVSFAVNVGAALFGGLAAFKFDGWWSTGGAVLSMVAALRAFNDMHQMST